MNQLQIKYLFLGLIFIAVLLEVVADVFFKYWALSNRKALLAIGFAIYFSGTAFWAYSLKYDFLARAASFFTVLNLILLVLAGVVIFKEELSLVNKIGIGLGIISLLLIEL